MVDEATLAGWVSRGESETQEFKGRTSSGCCREAGETLSAMKNGRGGRVLFGVEPDHTIVGQDVSDRTLEQVVAEVLRIDGDADATVERIPVGMEGHEVISVSVSRGYQRPYVYKGKAYKRVGNSTVEMSREDYNRVLLEAHHASDRWENTVAEGKSIEDLSTDEVVRTVEEAIRRGRLGDPGTRDPQELLRGLGLLAEDKLTRAAVALFARSDRVMPQFPQCRVRLARFKGVDKTEFIDNRQYEGNAFELLISGRSLSQRAPPSRWAGGRRCIRTHG